MNEPFVLSDLLSLKDGANFYLADLHVHTPVDTNFKCGPGVDLNSDVAKGLFASEMVAAARGKRLRILGITEHNDVSWIDFIRAAAADTSAGDQPLVVFPGVEVCTAEGIHLLVLFNPDEQVRTLDGFLSNIGITPNKRYPETAAVASADCYFDDVLNLLAANYEKKAICVPAHVDSDSGLFKTEKAVERYLNKGILAVESKKNLAEMSPGLQAILTGNDPNYGSKSVALINGSDARSVAEIGNKRTYIKMSSFTVEGLRQAFLDMDSRVRDLSGAVDPSYTRMIGMGWEGGSCFFKGSKLRFNRNLNAVVGGKASGKSTLIETLRYALGQEAKTDSVNATHYQMIKEVFRSGSTVYVVVYSKEHDSYYIIARTFPGEPQIREVRKGQIETERVDLSGELLNLSTDDVFNPDIFGQKELYEISDDKKFQLRLIDRFLPREFAELEKKEQGILEELETSAHTLLKVEKELDTHDEKKKQLTDISRKKKIYLKSGIEERLKEKTHYDEEKAIWDGIQTLQEEAGESLAEFSDRLSLDLDFLDPDNISQLPNKDTFAQIRLSLATLSEWFSEQIELMKKKFSFADETIQAAKSSWDSLFQDNEKEYVNVIDQLRREGVEHDPDEFIRLENTERQLKSAARRIPQLQQQLEQVAGERKQKLDEMKRVRLKKFDARRAVADRINDTLRGCVVVDLQYATDREDLIARIESYSTKENLLRKEAIRRMVYSDGFSVERLIKALTGGPAKVESELGLSGTMARNLYRAIPKQEYRELEICELGTKTFIKLYVGPTHVPDDQRSPELFREIENLSKGQKSTALLTLILLERDRPLIIDQPEDDIDNRFIVEDVVNKLRREKERRQFLIATHNANIAVFGDAEQIIVVDADADQGRIKTTGSIDDEPVKAEVECILEGGKEAFLIRKDKYGI